MGLTVLVPPAERGLYHTTSHGYLRDSNAGHTSVNLIKCKARACLEDHRMKH